MTDNKKTIKEYLPTAIVGILAVLCLYCIFDNRQVTTDWLLSVLPQSEGLRIAVVLLCFFLEGVIPFFSFGVITLASSMVFDTTTAIAVNCVGALLSMVAPYFIGKYLGAPYVLRTFSQDPRLWKIYCSVADIGFVSSFLLRVLGLSNIILGLLFGSLRMPFLSYLVSGFLGILPGLLCITILGSRWDFTSPLLWISLAVNIAIVACAYFYTRKKAGKLS